MAEGVRILFVGDIVGRPGRRMVRENLPTVRREKAVDLVIANGENAAGGFGITGKVATQLLDLGVDLLTMGNHTWDQENAEKLVHIEPLIVRPANYPPGTPGRGATVIRAANGVKVWVTNLLGQVFMHPFDSPFRTLDALLEAEDLPACKFVDFHAEASSEKQAFAWYADGRVSVVIGTHTHVPTSDERILPGGTGYQTDAGMTGPYHSVIGMDKDASLKRFLSHRSKAFSVAKEDRWFCATLFELDGEGQCVYVERIQIRSEG